MLDNYICEICGKRKGKGFNHDACAVVLKARGRTKAAQKLTAKAHSKQTLYKNPSRLSAFLKLCGD